MYIFRDFERICTCLCKSTWFVANLRHRGSVDAALARVLAFALRGDRVSSLLTPLSRVLASAVRRAAYAELQTRQSVHCAARTRARRHTALNMQVTRHITHN